MDIFKSYDWCYVIQDFFKFREFGRKIFEDLRFNLSVNKMVIDGYYQQRLL